VEGYQFAILVHLLGTLYLCAMVVRDILRPEDDVVRRKGEDDPSGGVLDRATDAVRPSPLGHPAHEEDTAGSPATAGRTDADDAGDDDPWKYRGGPLRKEEATGNGNG
jgi:hypothetical protein